MARGQLILVIGGARSGKSAFAERWACDQGGDAVLFIATAEAGDDEMVERIARHRARRPAAWHTVEAVRDLRTALDAVDYVPRVVVLDCLTLLVANELLADAATTQDNLERDLDAVIQWTRTYAADCLIVTNEVGQGIVPENALARTYRDLLGMFNQRIAQQADKVYWMVAGIPLEIKALAQPSEKPDFYSDHRRAEG